MDSLYLVAGLGTRVLNFIGGPMRPSDSSGMMCSKAVAFLHSLSGKVNKFAYGTSVLHAGAGIELVEAVTVTVVTDGGRGRAVGSHDTARRAVGKTWLLILHWFGGRLMVQTEAWA